MIFEWFADRNYRNFGDSFTEIIASQLPGDSGFIYQNDPSRTYFLIGSVIRNQQIVDVLGAGKVPVFIGCGWRGEPLDPDLVKKAQFVGVRGPNTQKEIARCGVDVDVTMDSAYPMLEKLEIEQFGPFEGKLLIPHISDNYVFSLKDASDVGMDKIVLPRVKDVVETFDLISRIANSEFVLAGAMHACIVAHFYGVPFAPFFGDWNDCPPKWFDWLESIGIPAEKMTFCKNYDEGREWYDSVASYL
jgi:hypothetical protein